MPYCANCGRGISAQAAACPQCGHPGPAGTVSLNLGTVTQTNYASYGARVGAYLIDFFVLAIPLFIILFALFAVADRRSGDGLWGVWLLPLMFIANILYKPLMEGARGQTLGKMAANIKVVRAEDAGNIDFGRAFLRWFIGTLFTILPYIGIFIDLLWPLWDGHMQTLHDKVAKTIVVKV